MVDFESVLELTAAILAAHPAAAAAVRDRYRYFVVDEYQDVNPLQKLLLDQWAGDRDDVCVVGDPRQTIYSFTGATPAYLTRFALQYPGATVIRLVRNYRSTPQVVALANRVFAAPGQALVAQRPGGPAPKLTEYADEQAEAAEVARQAAELVSAGTPAREMAVLVRTNAMTSRYEEALAAAGVPFQLRGAERFFDRTEVRQAVNLLRVAARSVSADEDPAAAIRPVLTGLGLTGEPPAAGARRGSAGSRSTRWLSWRPTSSPPRRRHRWPTWRPSSSCAARSGTRPTRAASRSPRCTRPRAWSGTWSSCPCLTDGAVPIVYAQSAEAIEEERRLLYVGITRARQRLFLSWSLARAPGGRRTRKPSRFLDELRGPAAPRSLTSKLSRRTGTVPQ